MIEEFGKMLGHVMGLKAMNQEEQALDELRAGYKTYFDLDATFIQSLQQDEFLEVILNKVELKNQQLEALAQALMTEGELVHFNSILLATELRKKSLSLYTHLEKTDTTTFSQARRSAIIELEQILAES